MSIYYNCVNRNNKWFLSCKWIIFIKPIYENLQFAYIYVSCDAKKLHFYCYYDYCENDRIDNNNDNINVYFFSRINMQFSKNKFISYLFG